jgi:hypothetical protein
MRALLRHIAELLLAAVILFEEWGWEPLQALLARLTRLPPLAWLERKLVALPPYAALAVFAVPALLLLPVKLAALALVARGQALLGLGVIVAAKLLGTAIVARLFALTQPSLMRLAWFARWHGRWLQWKAELLARVRASAVWRSAQAASRRLRAWWPRQR